MDFVLRKALENDAGEIAVILEQGYSIKSVEEGLKVFSNEKSKGWNFLVAESNAKVVGFVSWQMKGLPRHGLIELDRIAVSRDFRGKGVAGKLFGFMEEQAKQFFSSENEKLRKLFLFTHEDNKTAISFYEKMGMEKDALLKNHYYGNKNEIVMRKFYG
ncbi:MAG: GNAT family N-acetyltransferase [archaeon]